MAAPSLVNAVRRFLREHPPFSQMHENDIGFVASKVELAYFGPGETITSPDENPPQACWIVKQGRVGGFRRGLGNMPDDPEAVIELTPGEIFPVGALMADRPASSTYRAQGDTFCWRLSRADFDELIRASVVFQDFCRRRMGALLDLSRQASQASVAAQATQWRSMSQPLAEVMRAPAATAFEDEPLHDIFERMEAQAVGSVVVLRREGPHPGEVVGIFTRRDVIGRVVLPGVGLRTPVSRVMTTPVLCAAADDTVADAMLTMADRTVRHLPVTRAGELIGVVAERDLFVLQRRSLRQIGDAIASAGDVGALRQSAVDIREWPFSLVAQGVAAGFATRLISRLNDQLTARLLGLCAAQAAIRLDDCCWLALGSEGREEQTIASDQDNGLVIRADSARPAGDFLAFADSVNQALDRCGFPLCRGGIMAGNPSWCLTEPQWAALFQTWIERGDPDSLLMASIFFDLRPLAGNRGLVKELLEGMHALAAASPRFLKQMSDNALRRRPPGAWRGGLFEQWFAGEPSQIDLKAQGTGLFVDAARVYALAHGVRATGTAERFEALARDGRLPVDEVRAWIDAFQFLQSLRLRQQQRGQDFEHANRLDPRSLSELDQRILKEAFRQVRKLQQRLALDYPG